MTLGKQIAAGLCIALISSVCYGLVDMYHDVQMNSEHRHGAASVEEDIKDLKSDVQALRQDVCWIKEHLRGAKVPDCNID